MSWHRTRPALAGLLLLFCAVGPALAQGRMALNAEGARHDHDGPALRERTELVTLSVTVTDGQGRAVAGLKPEHFEVYEDKVRQQVEFFREDDSPASVGVVFDTSASMQGKIERAREAFQAFVEASHPDDEYFLVTFNEQATLSAASTDGDELLGLLRRAVPHGQTALYDAVYLALEALDRARHRKRALVVFSDGADNRSRYNIGELKRLVKERDVPIYCIASAGAESASCGRLCRMEAQVALDEIAGLTGGRAFFPVSYADLEDLTTRVALELRRRYSIGYTPSSASRDGRWRRVKLRVSPAGAAQGRLVARTREGYYAAP
jgi:Ca-activated chloride channel homolog